MKHKDRIQPSKLLDKKAQDLAQRHQQRLNAMSEAALDRSPRYRLTSQPALAFAIMSVAILSWWLMPSPDNEINVPAPKIAAIPAWVLDDQVPLELLESPEFYRWLATQAPSDEPLGRQQG